MSMTDVMDGLAALLTGVVYAFPADEVTVPCSVVGYPTEVTLLTVEGNKVLLPIWQVVGGDGEVARDAVSDALADAGSLKAALDGAHDWGDVRVTNAAVEFISIGAVSFPAIRFDVEVIT